jgi:hypothetical protein
MRLNADHLHTEASAASATRSGRTRDSTDRVNIRTSTRFIFHADHLRLGPDGLGGAGGGNDIAATPHVALHIVHGSAMR